MRHVGITAFSHVMASGYRLTMPWQVIENCVVVRVGGGK